MTPEIVDQLLARVRQEPGSVAELHRLAQSQGSTWSAAQVKLLLRCLPEVKWENDQFSATAQAEADPMVTALLQVVGSTPIPAAALVRRLPAGMIATPQILCQLAEQHPELEVVPPNRIRKR